MAYRLGVRDARVTAVTGSSRIRQTLLTLSSSPGLLERPCDLRLDARARRDGARGYGSAVSSASWASSARKEPGEVRVLGEDRILSHADRLAGIRGGHVRGEHRPAPGVP